MADKDFDIPESLEKALIAGEVIAFVGAGVSMAVKKFPLQPILDKEGKAKKDKLGNVLYKSVFPSWWEFLIKAADKLDRENKSPKAAVVRSLLNDSPPDYLEAAQRAFDGLQNKWYVLLSENFEIDIDSADKDSLKLAKLIWQLGSNLILTTNVDLVLQSVHEKPHTVKILDTQAPEFAEIQRNWKPTRPTVLHLHGHIDNKANVVFTKKQYDEFYNQERNQAKLETLRNLFTQRTILFIGFSLDDLFILKELERVNVIYKGGANSFYVLIRESEKDNPNIPNYVEPITFPEFDKPLEDLVEELARIAKEKTDKGKDNSDNGSPTPPKDSRTNTQKPFFNVPYNSKGKEFVGRKGKTKEIWDLLNREGFAAIGQAINVKGFGGLGKTQLAVEYAHAYRDEYKDGVFWVVADQPIDNQLLQIADRKGWINPEDKSVNQFDVAKEKFRALSDCLILFDNVETFDDIKVYLPETCSKTHILITSRERIAGFYPVYLELLERDKSRELLLKISGRKPQDKTEIESLDKILETLGDIPLAIELVGGYLAEHETVTFAKYHQFLEGTPLDRIEDKFPKDSFTNHDRSIIQTLRISEKTVNENPVMVEILKVLAWSGSSSMGISLLQVLVDTESDFEFETALADAHKLRLLKKVENAERYAIHRLLARVIRHEQPLASDTEWQTKIVRNLEDWFDEKANRYEHLAEFESEIEHLEVWQEQTFESNPVEAITLTRLRGNTPRQRGNYKIAFEWFQKALDLFENEKPDNKELLSNLLYYIGLIYSALGKHQEALRYRKKALKLNKELYGEKNTETATSYNDVGLTYAALNNHRQALKHGEKALQLYIELFGEKHSFTATSYNNVGYTYGELGDHQQALIYKEKALELRKELLGDNHPDTATSYNNVGYTYRELDNYQQALFYLEKALELRKKLLGDNHPDTAASYNNVGSIYGILSDHQQALIYKEKALELRKELFGDNHPSTASSYNNVGYTYGELGNHQQALIYKEKAVEIYQKLLGKQHPNCIIMLGNLISTYLILEEGEKAGKKVAEFYDYIPQNHPKWNLFEEISRPYREK